MCFVCTGSLLLVLPSQVLTEVGIVLEYNRTRQSNSLFTGWSTVQCSAVQSVSRMRAQKRTAVLEDSFVPADKKETRTVLE
mmetsp:Transcript_9056/g.26891  ORF Transcript_9056/g.26891 Transcript_9056/m.26891 type:complete len:81 (+) Transcript_9056:2035-2277(+)